MTAAVARVNSFDLLGPEGWEMLTQDVAADFPYLSLSDINATMALGRKGALDTGRAQPLNYTRIYKWVKARAVFSLGYWQVQHPALMAWAAQLDLTAALLHEIDAFETPAAAFAQAHKFRQMLQRVVQQARYPNLAHPMHAMQYAAQYPAQAEAYRQVAEVEHPAFLLRYPEQAGQHQPIF